jgi:hypothetical protein
MREELGCRGDVEMIVETEGGVQVVEFRNTILRTGREALALSLANRTGGDFDFFISRMLFGDGGAVGGTPKSVQTERTALFCNSPRVSKPVVANIDPNNGSQVTFTSVVSYDEGNGFNINEMALQLHGSVPPGGDSPSLYSMATFPGISKTSLMQLTFNWRISFI